MHVLLFMLYERERERERESVCVFVLHHWWSKLQYVRKFLYLESMYYFLIDYVVKVLKLEFVPFEVCFCAFDYKI